MKNSISIAVCLMLIFFSCGNGNKSMKSGNVTSDNRKSENNITLKATPSIIDLGRIDKSKQKIVKSAIKISNDGDKPLMLYKADVSCGCIKVELDKKAIPPHKDANILVYVNTENNNGHFNKAIFIRSNAKNDPEIIRVKGTFIN